MKEKFLSLLCAALFLSVAGAFATDNSDANGRPGTVNYFTPAQKARAFAAASRAGYPGDTIESFQDGNFFSNGT